MDRRALKNEARAINRTTVPSPFAITLVYLVICIALNYFLGRTGIGTVTVDTTQYVPGDFSSIFDFSMKDVTFFGLIVYICIEIVSSILRFGYIGYSLRVSRRETAGIPNLFDGFVLFGKVLLLNILISLFVFLWSLLLVIPGIIATFKYSMAIFLLIDHPDWSVMDCIRESKRIMKGHKWEYFGLLLSFIGWILLSVIPGVSIYSNPFILVTESLYYNRLVGYKALPGDSDPGSEEKAPWEY